MPSLSTKFFTRALDFFFLSFLTLLIFFLFLTVSAEFEECDYRFF